MERARQCLACFYEPDRDAEDRVRVLAAFGRSLRFLPRWAVAQAFDTWERDQTHRPAPGHIVKLASDAVAKLQREVERRGKGVVPALGAPKPEPFVPKRSDEERARAQATLEAAGFTPRRFRIAQTRRDLRPEHLAEGADDTVAKARQMTCETDPERLRRARQGSALSRTALEDAARSRGESESEGDTA